MINVLIIEDEHAIRRFLRTALEADGMRVFEAETPAAGAHRSRHPQNRI